MQDLLARAQRTSGLLSGGPPLDPAFVIDTLAPHMTPERLARIDAVLAGRTYTVATVVEGLVNTGNVRAVMRTAEGLGFQDFHVITGGEAFKGSERVSQGAEKWLDVHVWDSPAACARHLKERGFAIVATHLDEAAVPIDAVDFTQPTALVLGNERDGVSEAMLALADRRVVIPMTGFVQSFNISVAAALGLYHAYRDRLARQGYHGDLTEEQRLRLRAAYCLRSVRRAPEILQRALARRG
ncbi:hypothetical protein AWN76_010680 [Rhodothermaceae bacterium RA]|nr:hypothetical protein AWN76_010680 [Rhodothermaceae bacterium RA]